ncbi:IS3 family transposase [Shimazuella alba]|uniref:IS3 family transposase n=1 Tax=Shimazuella alba TaxID=2690964 RepID=A0A6I4VQ07_9BACL|nr:IS3 family transposase [Shimazuella alba]MXQ53153.1 IS3 family transposase [Shimazuella alba]
MNAAAKATFKIIKTEIVPEVFDNLKQLTIEFRDYVNWFNKFRIHGNIGICESRGVPTITP